MNMILSQNLFLYLFFLISVTVFGQNNLIKSKQNGKLVYSLECARCHEENGKGMKGSIPPLANSDYLMKNTNKGILAVLKGVSGKIKVNGITYYGSMVGLKKLSNKQVADVMNYVRNSWGNKGKIITIKDIALLRKK
jgi:mono/diheme cytochrome c family protein